MTHSAEKITDDIALLMRLREGDEVAFEIIFKRYYAPMVLFAVNYLHDKDRSESIVQDVFVKFWEKRAILEISSLRGYLVVSIRNRCHNELKRQGVVRNYEKSVDPDAGIWPQYQDKESVERISRVIEELPPRRKTIFKMSRIDGLKYKEIADKLAISPKTVEVQMGKALKFLREKLLPLKKQLLNS